MEKKYILAVVFIFNEMNISGYVHEFPVKFGHIDVDFAQCLPTVHLHDAIKFVWKKSGNAVCLYVHVYTPKI
jgi:hypothetical protein